MDEKEIKALIKAIDQLLGDPLQADARELEILFAEFGEGRNPAQSVFDLAARAAQQYRLEGGAVPTHVAEALESMKKALHGESMDAVNTTDVINEALNPIYGAVREVSYAFRNRKERTEKDTELLEELSSEVKRDWSEDKGK
jgi:hypothetical protein